jgi:hypothetical protein
MNAYDYLTNCISINAANGLPRHKYKAITTIIQRMLNKGLDPIDIYDEIRCLLDIDTNVSYTLFQADSMSKIEYIPTTRS